MKTPQVMILLFSDSSGIYIPQRFANEMIRASVTGVTEEDYAILEAGPDHEQYWDAWYDVCDSARITDPDTGTVYGLQQDGDCWMVDVRAEYNETGEGDQWVLPVSVAIEKLDTFTRAYIECALWSSTDNADPETGGEPLDKNYDIEDITRETLEHMIKDCADFQQANTGLLESAGDASQNGHDFWLTRNGHGAGFWGRGYRKYVGDTLSDASKAYGCFDLYVGDDDKIYS